MNTAGEMSRSPFGSLLYNSVHCRGPGCKSRKSRHTWNNSRIRPWSTKRSRPKSKRVLLRKHTGHSKHPLPTTQEKTLHRDITRWPMLKSDLLYSLQPRMEKLYRIRKTRPVADCGSDHELLIAKIQSEIEESKENH